MSFPVNVSRAPTSKRSFAPKAKPDIDIAEAEATRCTMLHLFVTSDVFDYCLAFVLLVNAILISIQVDHQARNFTTEVSPAWRAVGLIFCSIYIVELSLRLWVYKLRFFTEEGWCWNVFDIVIVTLQVAEEIFNL